MDVYVLMWVFFIAQLIFLAAAAIMATAIGTSPLIRGIAMEEMI